MTKVNFLNQAESFMQEAMFLNFIVTCIRKPENEGTWKEMKSNEKKSSGKDLNEIEARFAEGK